MSVFKWSVLLACLWCAPVAAAPVVLIMGDSLSSAYGMDEDRGWVNLLRGKLNDNGYPHEVVNASVSGDTTRDALTRMEETLARHQPDIVVVELGGNDGLRAFSIDTIRDNLSRILGTIRENGAKIVLTGMRMPPNYGPVYTDAFAGLYSELAGRYDAALVPFFMEGVATKPDLMQEDGIHPSAEAQPVLLDNVWPVLRPLLDQTATARSHRVVAAASRPRHPSG